MSVLPMFLFSFDHVRIFKKPVIYRCVGALCLNHNRKRIRKMKNVKLNTWVSRERKISDCTVIASFAIIKDAVYTIWKKTETKWDDGYEFANKDIVASYSTYREAMKALGNNISLWAEQELTETEQELRAAEMLADEEETAEETTETETTEEATEQKEEVKKMTTYDELMKRAEKLEAIKDTEEAELEQDRFEKFDVDLRKAVTSGAINYDEFVELALIAFYDYDFEDVSRHYTFRFKEANETTLYMSMYRTIEGEETGDYYEDNRYITDVEVPYNQWNDGTYNMDIPDMLVREGHETEDTIQDCEIVYDDATFPAKVFGD